MAMRVTVERVGYEVRKDYKVNTAREKWKEGGNGKV
jgi:hypothetical protein